MTADPLSPEAQPRTEAGKALVKDTFWLRSPNEIRRLIEDALPAIEDQAATEARRELLVDVLAKALRSSLYRGKADSYTNIAERLAAEYRRLIEDSDRG